MCESTEDFLKRLEAIEIRTLKSSEVYKTPTRSYAKNGRSIVFDKDRIGWEIAKFNEPQKHVDDADFFIHAREDVLYLVGLVREYQKRLPVQPTEQPTLTLLQPQLTVHRANYE